MTDRRRQESVNRGVIGRAMDLGALGLPQLLLIAECAFDARPHFGEQRAIVRVAKDLVGEKDEFTFAVVLGDRIGAARVDAAGNLAVRELVRRVPAQIVFGNIRVAQSQERFADHRAIADP